MGEITNLESENKKMRECLQNVQIWFKNFGFNSYGIAVQDDIEDPEEIKKEIENVLKEVE